jgi:aryl carrier-like protein
VETEHAIAAERVRAAWATGLGKSAFDDETGFFDAGGDSIGLLAVLGNLRVDWPSLRLAHLLEHPTVAQLSTFLETELT